MNAQELEHALGDSSRFEVIRVLGEGGMGTVYEALDRERSATVALKTLRDVHPDARFRFKHEFRSLQDIHHPNLVSLGEMFEENGQLFFTMELVLGAHFLEHLRGGVSAERGLAVEETATAVKAVPTPPLRVKKTSAPANAPATIDEPRIRDAFAQLARGLHALHLAGKVHRDVKPSNVLVTAEGRVVILDFGLVQSVAESERRFLVVGTARYMAPEQAAGAPAGPEADWYSVGVMLYLALTGSFPFQPSTQVRPSSRRRAEPLPPSAIVASVPPSLDALCVDLLRDDPAARPRGAEVLRRLGVHDERGPLLQRAHDAWFVGRRAELATLDAAFASATAGAARVVLIEGESGMGKSALMRRFLERLPAGALTLRGRCYERESVPYKAVDQLVDALGVHLSRLDAADVEALLPPDAEQLEHVFPVLRLACVGRLPIFAPAPPAPPSTFAPSEPALVGASLRPSAAVASLDPIGRRARVFAALRELLRRLAARAPLVLSIDDLQWADADSLALLFEVLRPPSAPALLLVATLRRGAGLSQRRFDPVFAAETLVRVSIGRLSAEDGRDLVGSLLEGTGGDEPRDDARPINADSLVEEAGGHPLFIDALLRHRLVQVDAGQANDGGTIRLDDALWARIGALQPGARRLLELTAVAGAPLRRDVAERCEAADAAEIPRRIAALQSANLIRVVGAGRHETLETFHDRVRETVVRRLVSDGTRALHARLARALEASESSELEALALHFQAAGEPAAALTYAVRAADQAARAFAFDHASQLYRTAIALVGNDTKQLRALEEKLADALASAGRGADAAEAYLRAGQSAPDQIRLEHERKAAENFLRAGYVDEGLRALRDVAAARGLEIPRTPGRALAALLFRRAELRLRGLAFTERPERDVPAAKLARIDVCWSAALGLALVDAVRGASFQTQNLLLSLEAGEPYRISRALSCEAAFLSTDGGGNQARVDDLLDRAEAIAARVDRPHALGLVAFTTGISRYCVGRFRESADALDRADEIFRERCTGVQWERGSVASFLTCDLWLLGDLREFTRRTALYRREAEDRGDRYLVTNLNTGFGNATWLLQDEPERAAAEAEAGMGSWSKEGFHFQHFLDFLARGHIDLYRGDGEAGHARLVHEWPRLTRSLNLRMQVARIFSTHLRGRAALAGALASRSPRALLRDADRAAHQLESERMEWALPFASLTRAAAAHLRGDDARALRLLDESILGLHREGLALFEAAARLRRGRLIGGDAGRAEVARAERWMLDRGVVSPERTTAMMAPGFRG